MKKEVDYFYAVMGGICLLIAGILMIFVLLTGREAEKDKARIALYQRGLGKDAKELQLLGARIYPIDNNNLIKARYSEDLIVTNVLDVNAYMLEYEEDEEGRYVRPSAFSASYRKVPLRIIANKNIFYAVFNNRDTIEMSLPEKIQIEGGFKVNKERKSTLARDSDIAHLEGEARPGMHEELGYFEVNEIMIRPGDYFTALYSNTNGTLKLYEETPLIFGGTPQALIDKYEDKLASEQRFVFYGKIVAIGLSVLGLMLGAFNFYLFKKHKA